MTPRLLNYIGFAVLAVATVLGFQSPWGILFLAWTVPNFYSGHTFLLSDIARAEDPILFWLIQFSWVAIGIMLLLSDFLPGWA